MDHNGALRDLKRFITTHNAEGQAIFSDAIPEDNPVVPISKEMGFALTYVSEGLPIQLNNDADISVYKRYLESPPSLAVPNGTVVRHVDIAPGLKHIMHRTLSIDYGIVLEGEVECVLDSGERRRMKRGDVCVQRGTMHAWENGSRTEWARMIFILQASEKVEVASRTLDEDLGHLAK